MTCKHCGQPTNRTETHHHNQRKGDNHPDNLQDRCRRCHHDRAHDNPRATDRDAERRYSPPSPNL